MIAAITDQTPLRAPYYSIHNLKSISIHLEGRKDFGQRVSYFKQCFSRNITFDCLPKPQWKLTRIVSCIPCIPHHCDDIVRPCTLYTGHHWFTIKPLNTFNPRNSSEYLWPRTWHWHCLGPRHLDTSILTLHLWSD